MAVHNDIDEDGNFTVTYDTPEDNPAYLEDGECIEINDGRLVSAVLEPIGPREFDAQADQIILRLHAMAAAKLEAGTIYEIRGKIPSNYGRGRGLAWYTNHWLQETPPAGAVPYPGRCNELGGYMYLGTFKAPHHG
jgi:hypothetical protein